MTRVSGRSTVIDLTMMVHAKSTAAIKVSDDGDPDHAVWLPLSQIEIEEAGRGVVEITLPEWLALEKGLI